MLTRHFTATGIVVDDGRVLLVKHAKLGWWLPPGGHLEADEDPVQGVLREVREEAGLDCAVVDQGRFGHPSVGVLPAPFTILVEDIAGDVPHQHIDFIYPLRPLSEGAGAVTARPGEIDGCRWARPEEIAGLHTPPDLPDLVAAVVAHLHHRPSALPASAAANLF